MTKSAPSKPPKMPRALSGGRRHKSRTRLVTARRKRDIRANLAARATFSAQDAAETLFHAGGHAILKESDRQIVRRAARRLAEGGDVANSTLSASSFAGEISALGVHPAPVITRGAALGAVRSLVGAMGRAASAGALIDGGIAAFEATVDYSRGSRTAGEAVRYVTIEAGTGGAATAVGTGFAIGVVVLTGPMSPLVLASLAGGICIITKIGLQRWLHTL